MDASAPTSTPAIVLAVIAEMQAKLNNPDSERFTKELATLTLQGLLPMVSKKDWPVYTAPSRR